MPKSETTIEVPATLQLMPFRLPKFLKLGGVHGGEKVDVGRLTDAQAEAYWKAMGSEWAEQVRARRMTLLQEQTQEESGGDA